MTNVHFLGSGPPIPPWGSDDPGADDATRVSKIMKRLKHLFPASYQSAYVDKAIKNFWRVNVDPPGPFESLAGAVTDHNQEEKKKNMVRSDIRRLVAVVSNLHRSFLDEGKLVHRNIKPPLPPLAQFTHDPIQSKKITAFTIVSTDKALKALKTHVPVVNIPSSYRNDLLLWGVLAHETCGHPLLHAIPGLLDELRKKIGTARLPDGPVLPTHGTIPREALLAIWKYWLEEAASDVYAVLNIGPSYGLGWGLFMAGLNASFLQVKKTRKRYDVVPESTRKGLFLGNNRLSFKHIGKIIASGKIHPELSVKSLANADQHPIDILTLYVVMGALETLGGLRTTTRRDYVREIESIAALCGKHEKQLVTVKADTLNLSQRAISRLRKKRIPGIADMRMFKERMNATTLQQFSCSRAGERLHHLWIGQPPYQTGSVDMLVLPQTEMKKIARRVGAYIATTKLKAFKGQSVQDVETWDDRDEEIADRISSRLIENKSVAGMGDDAQLLAGGILAFYQQPDLYKPINSHLMKALDVSFDCDPIWNPPTPPSFLRSRRH